MSERDYFVEFPKAVPPTGTTVLYSSRPYVSASSGRPPVAGAVQSGERTMNHISGWAQTDVAGTIHLQGWDSVGGAWVNIDGAGTELAANTLTQIAYDLPGGDYQIIVTFAGTPTVWKVPSSWRLTKRLASS